ncbi:hypothetical protein [Sphingomonas sp. Ag1]|uniref:hypothetical protein n=1 Tax=Sphingomonas sp. Ag1 TaxID=1642949 RepID=UPI000A5E20AD|nr:hypothetical protein [Sphingomonas sp. Ag1]
MIKATAAVEAETFKALDAGVTGAAVFQDVPDDQPLPVVIIGELLSVPFAGADDPDRRITLVIGIQVEGDERGPCTDIQDEVEALLAGVTIATDDWNLHYSVASSAAELAEDGSGYVGTTILTILAFSNS